LVSVADQKPTSGPYRSRIACRTLQPQQRVRRRASPRLRCRLHVRKRPPRCRSTALRHYYQVKATIFGALIEAIDLAQLAKLDVESAREEIRDIVNEIIAIKNIVMSIAEQEELLDDICNDVLGYGPLEPLLARDDIADIMVNGAGTVFIEVGGKIQKTASASATTSSCSTSASASSARSAGASTNPPDLRRPPADGSRVNASYRRWRSTARAHHPQVQEGQADARPARQIRRDLAGRREILQIIGRVRCNVLISGGTGSGKTTLLNCLTNYIDEDERVITCEDAAELQLQQPHVVRLETRPPNIEGEGQITMRDLVKNCLRMRPERIIVGEVRGPEAFDLLQAMNTGHDGSMGTLHANNPREASPANR
jgi:pilus assembly protein CpaF